MHVDGGELGERVSAEQEQIATTQQQLETPNRYVAANLFTDGSSVNAFSRAYDELLDRIDQTYDELLEYADSDETAAEEFVEYIARQRLQQGELFTEDDRQDIEQEIEDGNLSTQIAVYEDIADEAEDLEGVLPMAMGMEPETSEETVEGMVRRIAEEYTQLQKTVEAVYGEYDPGTAYVAESLLRLPSAKQALQEEADSIDRESDIAFLDSVVTAADAIDPDARYNQLIDTAEQLGITVDWQQPANPATPNDADTAVLQDLYDAAARIRNGDRDLDSVYDLLSNTHIRRNDVLDLEIQRVMGMQLPSLEPTETEDITYDDIGGYTEQTAWLKNFVDRIADGAPVLDKANRVILEGYPGAGKSMSVTATINALPDDATAIRLKAGNGDLDDKIDYLTELADLHPDQYIIAAVDDIDRAMGGRMGDLITSRFLEMDSINDDQQLPDNLTLFETTNRPDEMDQAVLRSGRAFKVLRYEHPDKTDRAEILDMYAAEYDVDLPDNAPALTEDLFGSDLEALIDELRMQGITDPDRETIEQLADDLKQNRDPQNYLTEPDDEDLRHIS